MPLSRRTLLKTLSASVALAAVGTGVGVQWRRSREKLSSAPITGEWDALGPGILWLLPDLDHAPMVVPDRPHKKEETTDPGRRREIRRVRSFSVTTGHARLRGGDPAPRASRFRILCIGDSVTFGWGVEEGESWPRRLEAELADRVEVVNAGVPGLGLNGIGAYLSRVAPQFSPDGVLVCRRAAAVSGDPFREYVRAMDLARLALPKTRFQILLPPISRFDPTGQRLYPDEAPTLRRLLPDVPVLELTEPMRAAQGERGCALKRKEDMLQVVRLETGEIVSEAKATERDLPVTFYDLFERDPTVREALFFDDGHPDAEGLTVLARAAAEVVLRERWVPG